tara:strand:+ start:1151 stop:1678 length:528 start_codon:yes stop_codon:yes gene_type:complete
MARPVKRENLQMTVKKAQRREPPTDYLKFFKVARYWAKRKYELSGAEVDMLLFLRSEHIFARAAFDEYMNIFSWDTRIFHTLLKNGWIVKWREPYKTRHALYELSFKGKRLVSDIYKKCSGEDDYSLIPHRNPCFDRKNANYMDKVYSSQMLKINKINREARLKPVKIRPPHRGG